jgi:hypothetical protein
MGLWMGSLLFQRCYAKESIQCNLLTHESTGLPHVCLSFRLIERLC